jgi:uncharacterized membrane-anchored protein
MKTRLALAVVVLQALVLAFMAGQREWIARTGAPLTLRTAPIDPHDPMRGAYLRLDYEISAVPPDRCRGQTSQWVKITDYRERLELRDHVVYAMLKVNPHGVAELVALDDAPPTSGPFLRGRVQSVDATGIRVRYGIEAFFLSQDAAQKAEEMLLNQRAGAPMNAHIAVGSSGLGVLKDYEWETLGLTIAFDQPLQPPTRAPGQPWRPQPLTGLTATLHNYGDQDLAIVTLTDARSFRLVPNTRLATTHYAWVGEKRADHPAPRAQDIIVLPPGAKHSVHLDLTQPPWWITDTNKPGSAPLPLQSVPDGWAASFRLEYAPPDADATRGLPHADLIRHAPLLSRAFNANQGVD